MNYNSILNFIAALAEENNPLNVNHLALLKKCFLSCYFQISAYRF